MGKLDGKIAVLTGATTGMALATAKLFVAEGAFVFITGRRKNKLDEAVASIGRNAMGIIGDSSDLSDLDLLFETVKREKGKIDILFASAGGGKVAPIGGVTEANFDQTFNLNTRGTFFTVQKSLDLFADGGSIILNGSTAASKGFPGFSVYGGSKAAIRAFARSWVVDLKTRNIRVNVISPGTIDTAAIAPFGEQGRAYFASQVPRGSIGRPEEVASAALFLASDDSSFVNGAELLVDGGTIQV